MLFAWAILLSAVFPSLGKNPPSPPPSSLPDVSYRLMFDKDLDKAKVEEVIKQCSVQGPGFRSHLPPKGEAIGEFAVMEVDAPLSAVQQCLTNPHKEKIFKSSIFEYEEEVDSAALQAFVSHPEGRYTYVSRQKVNGRFRTRFAYPAWTELVKCGRWIICRETMTDKAEEIRGFGGYLEVLAYFTLLVDMGGNRTFRISGCWNDAGGKIPRIGKVRAKHDDIYAGFKSSYKDLLTYLKIEGRKKAGNSVE
jgi:hypothetical protein